MVGFSLSLVMRPTRNATDESPTKSVLKEHGGRDDPALGRFVVSKLCWEHAAGVSPSLGRVTPAGRIQGWNRSPAHALFDNPVDRLRTRNLFERSLEGSRRGCGSRSSR